MIELIDCRGNKVLIHTKDIREVTGHFDQRYPNVQSLIILYDGKKIECSLPYNVVKNIIYKPKYQVIKVKNCEGCPFVNLDNEYGYDGCSIQEIKLVGSEQLPGNGVHKECPLKEGDFLVKLQDQD